MSAPTPSPGLDPARVAWRATRHLGVSWYPFDVRALGGPADEDAVVLIRMDPGCGYPRHRHLGIEDVLVLQGGYRDELGEHRAGAYLRYPAGSTHAPVALGDPARPPGPDNPSCLLFAIARGGVENT
jgi:anti-sigma factor ChrR (cupin superfamily)